VMDTVTSNPHPRLMYLAFPAVYLLAAHGVANVYRLVAGTERRPAWLPARAARSLAVAVAAALVLAAVLPGQASLWGDWSFDLMFHFKGV
jgi:hypothetical protein